MTELRVILQKKLSSIELYNLQEQHFNSYKVNKIYTISIYK